VLRQQDVRLATFEAADVRRACEAMRAAIRRTAERAPWSDAEALATELMVAP